MQSGAPVCPAPHFRLVLNTCHHTITCVLCNHQEAEELAELPEEEEDEEEEYVSSGGLSTLPAVFAHCQPFLFLLVSMVLVLTAHMPMVSVVVV